MIKREPKPYTPKGAIVPFIKAAKADPDRVFTPAEITVLIGTRSNKVGGSLTYALRAGVIFRGKVNGRLAYKGSPFEEGAMDPPPVQKRIDRAKVSPATWITTMDDLRVPKVVPGWVPPQMVAPRSNA